MDFEDAVCFEPGSDPTTHVVAGIPKRSEDDMIHRYGRPMAPEMESGAPYNAFSADVWQLGRTLLKLRRVSLGAKKHLIMILTSAEQRASRPAERAV